MNATSILCRAQRLRQVRCEPAAGAGGAGGAAAAAKGPKSWQLAQLAGGRHFNFVTKPGPQLTACLAAWLPGSPMAALPYAAGAAQKSFPQTFPAAAAHAQAARTPRTPRTRTNRQQKLGIRDLRAHK